jgi:hypothetical protein
MNKAVITIGIFLVLLLTGCSDVQVDAQNPDQGVVAAISEMGESGTAPQSIQNAAEVTRLLFGTLMLEGTDHAITPDQATELLPLWKLYRSLLESDITATAEIEAVAKQLSQVMTPEQLAAMDSLEFDREQMNGIMEELGIDIFGGAAGRGDGSTPPDGLQPGRGGGPGGVGAPGGGADFDPEVMATRQAEREASGGFQRGFNLPLVEVLIEMLEECVG